MLWGTPIIAERIFKASHKIVTVGDHGRKGRTVNFGCYGGDAEWNDNRLSIYLCMYRSIDLSIYLFVGVSLAIFCINCKRKFEV